MKNIPMKEIHDAIGNEISSFIPGFVYKRATKQVVRKLDQKTDIICWNCKKYDNMLHLSFCVLIRHHKIDSLYETMYQIPTGKTFAVWDGLPELGDTSVNTQYHISSMGQLAIILKQVKSYLTLQTGALFDQLNTHEDFFRYLCLEKKIFSYSESFALKRIMFCYLVDKQDALCDVHQYNLACCQSPPSGTDSYLKRYMRGLAVLDKYYGDLGYLTMNSKC